jgi:hypothetical protein
MTGQSVRLLAVAVRPRVVLKYLGVLLLSIVAMAAVPALVAFCLDAPMIAVRFASVAVALLAVGRWLARLPVPPHIQLNEALLLPLAPS